ncbi:MAG: helix-turn-helix domain-containing protein [Saprospiraceae bacterium]|nr:MAG: helix-turn-helix domain-containing protein [Saprospiraceae bacterium]
MNDHNIPSIIQANRKNASPLPNMSTFQIWETMLEKSICAKSRAGILARKFTHLVDVNFREQHSPLFYACELNISKSYLRKICNKAIGLAPSDYIYARLMLEASTLLKGQDKTVKEIGFDLGFKYPSHFSRFFKAQSGLSPDGYQILHLKAG